MYCRSDHSTWTARAPAKLNLRLKVKNRREDGFHELETVMVPIRLSDSLALARTRSAAAASGPIELVVRHAWRADGCSHGGDVPAGPENLVVRALRLLQERSRCRIGARVELVKRVPSGAGLGGGSSDAATALRLASRAWDLNWSTERLAEIGSELGSDVPFFFGHGAAICRGRGERVESLPPLPVLHFVIVKPPVALSTAPVYEARARLGSSGPQNESQRWNQAVWSLRSGRWGRLRDWLHNSLQRPAAMLTPWVERLKAVFDELDCLGHQLSGSGSAYFGVCRHAQHARRLATMLRTRQLGLVYATRSHP